MNLQSLNRKYGLSCSCSKLILRGSFSYMDISGITGWWEHNTKYKITTKCEIKFMSYAHGDIFYNEQIKLLLIFDKLNELKFNQYLLYWSFHFSSLYTFSRHVENLPYLVNKWSQCHVILKQSCTTYPFTL